MAKLRKQNQTAHPLQFLLVQSADHTSPLTGATPTVKLSKNGGAGVTPSGAVTEIDATGMPGWYQVAGNATDSNTLGPLILHATAASGDPMDTEFQIVAFDPNDAAALGLTRISGDAFARLGAPAGASIAADIAANQTAISGLPSAAANGTAAAAAILTSPSNKLATNGAGQVTATNGGSALTASDVLTAFKADAEWRKMLSHAAGKYTFNRATGVLTLFDRDGTTTLGTLTLTADAAGNVTTRA